MNTNLFQPVFLIVLLGAGVLQGCSLMPRSGPAVTASDVSQDEQSLTGTWPAGIPPQQVYIRLWEADSMNRERQSLDEYLHWVVRFYQGQSLIPGWLDITDQLRQKAPDESGTQILHRMQALGRTIGSEWARDNAVRRIDSRMLAVWRQAFDEALQQNDVLSFLDRCEADVEGILKGELRSELIALERYFDVNNFF